MERNKWLSRKFLVAIGTIVVTLAIGFGYKLDPALIAILTASESALWLIIEGVIDAINKK